VELEEHLFRRESGRLVAILTRLFGVAIVINQPAGFLGTPLGPPPP
jgi:hypothetical protein